MTAGARRTAAGDEPSGAASGRCDPPVGPGIRLAWRSMKWLQSVHARGIGPMLAVMFAMANLGLPAADVILDHRLGSPVRTAHYHLEDRNGCREHTGHCALGRMLGAVRLQGLAASVAQIPPANSAAVPSTTDESTIRPALPRSNRSRAPPHAA